MELVYNLGGDDDDRQQLKRFIIQSYIDVIQELSIWESYASEDEYIAGSEFTLADCTFYPTLAYLTHRGLDKSFLPNLKRS